MPNQLVGQVLRSPHAHAIIKSIDTSKAKALKGVKAVVTRDEFEDMPSELACRRNDDQLQGHDPQCYRAGKSPV